MANEAQAIGPGLKAVKGGSRSAAGQNTKLMPRQTIEWAWVCWTI